MVMLMKQKKCWEKNEGLTGSIVLRSGCLSELTSQLQVLLKDVGDVQFSHDKYDRTLLVVQVLSSSSLFNQMNEREFLPMRGRRKKKGIHDEEDTVMN
ncbi:hypothetical protein V6N13_057732 [Hibiscus sabdariffa]